MPERIFRYFPSLTDSQKDKISALKPLYDEWNSRINVISRKDMDNFYIHHVLHSLSIAKVINFNPGIRILDFGTGGGFPGIPLAIFFPAAEFTLLDSIEKKLRVTKAVAGELHLDNVRFIRKRIEDEKSRFDFVVSRAVTSFPEFVKLTSKNLVCDNSSSTGNGILYLKGGDLEKETGSLINKIKIWEIRVFFSEPYFETKKIIYLPAEFFKKER